MEVNPDISCESKAAAAIRIGSGEASNFQIRIGYRIELFGVIRKGVWEGGIEGGMEEPDGRVFNTRSIQTDLSSGSVLKKIKLKD